MLPLALLFFSLLCLAPVRSHADSLFSDHGKASWYGTTAHGKVTANGEIFNRYNLTAAHRSLPFGLVLRVHNLNNGRHVLVRVNDRGPFAKNRMLDISRRAADALKMLNTGTAPIAYEIVSDKKGVPLNRDNAFFVHIRNESNALKAAVQSARLAGHLQRPVKVLSAIHGKKSVYALCIGPFDNFSKAQKEFLRCEQESVSMQGIVEAPATGDVLPRHAMPGKKAFTQAVAGKKQPDEAAPAENGDVGQSYGAALQAIWGRSLEKGAHFLDLALGAVSGVQGNQPVFRLHYSVLSGYLDVSS